MSPASKKQEKGGGRGRGNKKAKVQKQEQETESTATEDDDGEEKCQEAGAEDDNSNQRTRKVVTGPTALKSTVHDEFTQTSVRDESKKRALKWTSSFIFIQPSQRFLKSHVFATTNEGQKIC